MIVTYLILSISSIYILVNQIFDIKCSCRLKGSKNNVNEDMVIEESVEENNETEQEDDASVVDEVEADADASAEADASADADASAEADATDSENDEDYSDMPPLVKYSDLIDQLPS